MILSAAPYRRKVQSEEEREPATDETPESARSSERKYKIEIRVGPRKEWKVQMARNARDGQRRWSRQHPPHARWLGRRYLHGQGVSPGRLPRPQPPRAPQPPPTGTSASHTPPSARAGPAQPRSAHAISYTLPQSGTKHVSPTPPRPPCT